MTVRNFSLMIVWLVLMPLIAQGERDGAASAGQDTATLVTHVDAHGASGILAGRDDVLLLDIRTPREFRTGHIRGATNIDFYKRDFPDRLAEIDRAQPILIYCRTGRRTTKALDRFRRLGFAEIIHLDGGITAWSRTGRPITK